MVGNDEVIDKFVVVIEECRKETEKIYDLIEEHLGYAPLEIHYGHVGDANRLLDLLTGITDIFTTKNIV